MAKPVANQELEVKFFLPGLKALEARLVSLGARLVQPRVHEINLRFDTPENGLTNACQVLRLRQDTQARVTYKGPGVLQDGVRLRQELEFTVSDFATAQALLEALGYVVVVMYEKYRAVYDLGTVHVTLDEMPYGCFAEIEGPTPADIRAAARQLALDWEKRINDSYMVLFQNARQAMGFTFRDLSFANFEGLAVSPQALGIEKP
ncbi:MAG: class IV adenylate cyclase [Chloroflexota bacterium]